MLVMYMLQIGGNMLFRKPPRFSFDEQIQKLPHTRSVTPSVSFGWKCDKGQTQAVRSLLSPGALSRKCLKGNHKKSFPGDKIAYLQVRCPIRGLPNVCYFLP